MGFYPPEVIIGDAKRHGVRFLPPDVNQSEWNYTLEGNRQIRVGLRTISGLGEKGWDRLRTARDERAFTDLRDFCLRTHLPRDVVSNLIRAGACDAFGPRRHLLWQLAEIDYRPEELPFVMPIAEATLPALEEIEETEWEYELMGFSARGHAMRHYRAALNHAGAMSTAEVKQQPDGRRVRVAGAVVVRQAPPTAQGVVFISLEDEYGLLDLVVKPAVYERYRSLLRGPTYVFVEGLVQHATEAISVLVSHAIPCTP